MTIAPADFATPLCIAGEKEGSVEDEERERERGEKMVRGEMDRERRKEGEEKEDREGEEEKWEGRRGANAEC